MLMTFESAIGRYHQKMGEAIDLLNELKAMDYPAPIIAQQEQAVRTAVRSHDRVVQVVELQARKRR